MSNPVIPRKIAQGFYPQRGMTREAKLESKIVSALGRAKNLIKSRPKHYSSIIERVNIYQETFRRLDGRGLRDKADGIRLDLKVNGLTIDHVARAFALVREVADKKLGLRHYDEQLRGGWVLLNGMVAEMETGEGKTLTATLPACTAALAGIHVHIITVNDYLAGRDADLLRPIYETLGLKVGVIKHGMSLDERRIAYGCDVTYCTNKDIVFDYLKDRLLFGQQPGYLQMRIERLLGKENRLDQLLLRGLSFAIVDEADSVFVDEARTPLIISGPVDNTYEEEIYKQSLELSGQLDLNKDYTVDVSSKTLEISEQGKDNLRQIAEPLGGIWKGRRLREEFIRQALTAQHVFLRDEDYIVKDGKVQIVDEYTGRVMEDRTWERGLHQLIEAKEGCDITPQNATLARISYQRFFKRYHWLSGMTGTAREVSGELWSVYGLAVVSVPTHKPVVRCAYTTKIYKAAESKWKMIVQRIAQMYREGRPVLVGTRSVATSEHLSKLLSDAGLPHRVLNARQNREEAGIVAQAGQKGEITVATNLAGRGTDIVIAEDVRELGGLHVIATEYHDARRIDRQLFGRCGRQGDPGSFEMIASLDDELFERHSKTYIGFVISRLIKPGTKIGRLIGRLYASFAQWAQQRKHFLVRQDLLKFDENFEDAIAFSGRGE